MSRRKRSSPAPSRWRLGGAIGEGGAFCIPLFGRLPQPFFVRGERQREGVSRRPPPVPRGLKLQVKADHDPYQDGVKRESAEGQVLLKESQRSWPDAPPRDRVGHFC